MNKAHAVGGPYVLTGPELWRSAAYQGLSLVPQVGRRPWLVPGHHTLPNYRYAWYAWNGRISDRVRSPLPERADT